MAFFISQFNRTIFTAVFENYSKKLRSLKIISKVFKFVRVNSSTAPVTQKYVCQETRCIFITKNEPNQAYLKKIYIFRRL